MESGASYRLAALATIVCMGPSCATASDLSVPEERPESADWYVYSDAGSSGDHGHWTNWMPDSASETVTLAPGDSERPFAGSTCMRATVRFRNTGDWAGVAVASEPSYWGDEPGPGFDLSGARSLVFHARGERGGEALRVKVAIAGAKPYGDSALAPIASPWFELSRAWRRYELPLHGDTSRVVTLFAWVTSAAENPGRKRITFYLDDIHFTFLDHR